MHFVNYILPNLRVTENILREKLKKVLTCAKCVYIIRLIKTHIAQKGGFQY